MVTEHTIRKIETDSVAEELGILPGDIVLSVDGEPIEDVFDWRMLTSKDCFLLRTRRGEEEYEYEIEMEEEENLGIVFDNDLMSDYKHCTNKCIFCFIDQMPPGMRETLYFKDDDSRLSFLQGNYVTLTNMTDSDVDRIIRYRMEPINISVHTTSPALRVRMLNNRFAGKVLSYLDRFYEAGIHMNAQIVLCKGYNDGEELKKTVSDLYQYAPILNSVSIVPVGLTKYRDGLTPLLPITKEDAVKVLRFTEEFQEKAYKENGTHFIHASDEFYILAGEDFPPEEVYDDYPQLENGVGMVRLLLTEAREELDSIQSDGDRTPRVLATGMISEPVLSQISEWVSERFPEQKNRIVGVKNTFFGETVTVAGLVTGNDILRTFRGNLKPNESLYLPSVMFRSGEDVFLDDYHKSDIEKELGTEIVVLPTGGRDLVRVLTGLYRKDSIC